MPHPGQPVKPSHLKKHREMPEEEGFIKNKNNNAEIQNKASVFFVKKKVNLFIN